MTPIPGVLVPLTVLGPLLAAAVCLVVSRRPRIQNLVTVVTLAGLVGVAFTLLVLVDRHGTHIVQVGGWDAPVGISLVVDRLSALMLLVSSVVLLAVIVFAVGQGVSDGDDGRDAEQPVSIFLPTYLALAAGLSSAFVAGDVFTLFVGFEILLAASFVLLTLGASAERVRAGVSYTVVSMVSSVVFLVGIALAYAACGTLNLADLAVRMQSVPEGLRTAIWAVFLVAFGIKAAVFPLSTWLPDSYPTAPAPVTAVFAGLLTKVGVYAIIRFHSLVFPGGSLDGVLMVAALLTMLVGILGAIAQADIKRILSFTLVSHIGYMVFGIALGSTEGLGAAIYYIAHHILVQTSLFLVVGLVERQAGSTSLRRLGSLAATSPLLAVLFLVPALNLGGIPPLSGFLGKLAVIQAGAEHCGALAWTLVGGSAVTSLFTLYVVVRVWSKAFWRPRGDAPEGGVVMARPLSLLPSSGDVEYAERTAVGRMPWSMVLPTAALIGVSLAMTLFAGPLLAVTDRAAEGLSHREGYIASVAEGHGTPGRDVSDREGGR